MQQTANQVPVVERESQLWSASEQYMRGQITLKQLEDVEHRYALPPDSLLTSTRNTAYTGEVRKSSAFKHFAEFISKIFSKNR